MPFRVNERIDERREGRDKNRGDPDDGCMAEEDGKQRDHPGDDPYMARETVGVIPVILVVKRPREADAHGVVMAALGQIIADGDEKSRPTKIMPKRETLMAKPSALRYMDRPANRLTAGQTHRMSCAIFSEIFCFWDRRAA